MINYSRTDKTYYAVDPDGKMHTWTDDMTKTALLAQWVRRANFVNNRNAALKFLICVAAGFAVSPLRSIGFCLATFGLAGFLTLFATYIESGTKKYCHTSDWNDFLEQVARS